MGRDTLFSYAYGQRAVPKLAEMLSDKTRTEEERVQTLTSLNNLLASQEEKCAATSAIPSIPHRLEQLIRSETEPVRRLSADCLASLATVMQGRIAIAEYDIVPAMTDALRDKSPNVRTAAARALRSVATSRDGCALLAADEVVQALVAALDVDEQPTIVAALSALASLTRLDVGVGVAIAAMIIEKLRKCIALGQRTNRELLLCALQCLFNIANTADGKAAAIHASLLPALGALCVAPAPGGELLDPETVRLAVGCIMATTIAKEGKFAAADSAVVGALCDILVDAGTDPFTLRSVVAAMKNIAELPRARAEFAAQLAPHGVDMLMIADGAVWPDSNRYVHQNVAPGGVACDADRALRAQWGYPEPHPSSYDEPGE